MSTYDINPIREYEKGHLGEESQAEEINSFMEAADTDICTNSPTDPAASFDSRYEDLNRAARRHPLLREIMYKMLELCREETDLEFLEKDVSAFPEYETCRHSVLSIARILVNHHGLTFIERTYEGDQISESDKEGLTEDEVDDLVAYTTYQTTEEGLLYLNQHAPSLRMEQLLSAKPSYKKIYIELLGYIGCDKRSYSDIQNLLRGRRELETFIDGHMQLMQPSVLVDDLEQAGAIVWNDGWRLSEIGSDCLAEASKAYQ